MILIKSTGLKRVLIAKGEMQKTVCRNEFIKSCEGGLGRWEFANTMLYCNLPSTRRADLNFIRFVLNTLPSLHR